MRPERTGWPGPVGDRRPFLLLTGVTRLSIAADLLHVVDLGVASYLVGGTLSSLYHEAGNPKEFLGDLWIKIQEGYRAVEGPSKSRMDFWGPSSFLKNPKSPGADWPKWRGKGAETRHFVPALLYAVASLPGQTSPFAKLRRKALEHMAAFYFELEPHRAAQQLPPAAARALKHHSAALLKAYSELSMTQEGLFYNVAPKMHYLTHLVTQSQFTKVLTEIP